MALRFGNESIPASPTNGLIVNLNLSNTSSYPGTGTTITDLSGNSNNFTIVGSPSYTAPTLSTPGYLSFPGLEVTRYIVRNPFSMPANAVSVIMWVRPTAGYTGDATPFSYEVTGFGNNLLIIGQQLRWILAGAPADARSNIDIQNGTWTQIAFTSNRTTGASIIYINSSRSYSQNMQPGTSFQTSGSLVLMQEQDGPLVFDPNQAFSGDFSSLKMYNRVLSPSEIAVIFNNERTLFGV